MTRVFSGVFVAGAVCAIALLVGQQTASSTNVSPSIGVATSPASLQTIRGSWKLKINGRLESTYSITVAADDSFRGKAISQTDNAAPEIAIAGHIRKGRGRIIVSWVEQETREQHLGKGLGCSAYAGRFEGNKVVGTRYDADGDSAEFELTK